MVGKIKYWTFIQCIIVLFLFTACARKRSNVSTGIKAVEEEPVTNSEIDEEDSISLDTINSKEADDQEINESAQNIQGVEIPVIKQKVPNQILKRYAYTLSYNKSTRCPNWVAWKLTASHTDGPYRRKDFQFHEDMDVPSPRAYYSDYSHNSLGLQRGHMCPAGDNKWSERAMDECHLLSNVCPQFGDLNGGEWKYLEEDCREWAKDYKTIYIVCGPVFYNRKHITLGEDKISVPDAFFKVILRLGKNPQALGFIYPNKDCSGGKARYVMSVDEVEKVTGMDFFSSLDDKIENEVERKSNLQLWN
ncbi:MAG: DNA/RNA non-specific endonuclease [Prevotella sp.]|jgi:endonuclease G|nr:DNA/RNA non-specific endonuclease [Prevotella sp.]MCH4183574.1 DNA/RNA non-specific endonuclease [Prevotella sp.]HAT62946.1 nuclease [Prevotella sp.]